MNKRLNHDRQNIADNSSTRLRAAWLYHNQRLTQNQVAERLGVSRATVVRMLDEAQIRNEVKIWIDEDINECVALAIRLEEVFGIDRAIVAPQSENQDRATASVGAVLGRYMSENLTDGMTIGVGWGRTLMASLASFVPPRHSHSAIVSLMGGLINPGRSNPIEFSWRMAGKMDARCYLYPAPVIVNDAATKQTLLNHCGLSEIAQLAENLDMAIVSCGDTGGDATSLAKNIIDPSVFDELGKMGSVCDVMCNFVNAQGMDVCHPIAERTMSVDLDTVARAHNVVLATGGQHRAPALLAAIRRLRPNTLITDEGAAQALLEMVPEA